MVTAVRAEGLPLSHTYDGMLQKCRVCVQTESPRSLLCMLPLGPEAADDLGVAAYPWPSSAHLPALRPPAAATRPVAMLPRSGLSVCFLLCHRIGWNNVPQSHVHEPVNVAVFGNRRRNKLLSSAPSLGSFVPWERAHRRSREPTSQGPFLWGFAHHRHRISPRELGPGRSFRAAPTSSNKRKTLRYFL